MSLGKQSKGRIAPKMDDVSNINDEVKISTNKSINTEINDNINNENKNEDKLNVNEKIDMYFKKETKVNKKQVSIYLDEDVVKAFNKFGRKEGKGAKSDLINNFLKKMFNIRQDEQ
ncbi:hypothetical protein BEH_26190 (plasmid) [Priestia filamentosa]|uniref:Uncharacterized protein n=1 Tax=Priestia filamentosa TaxID=1402861 RepID=A0A2L1FFX9_9BACI|nr:hypothetical protein [Priestia filamentosa]AVD54649.1 hypothetical protein CKF96_04005 [Priestia filamentosa]AWG44847.1 hypothetical protein BEH_26190 [Priestia filamentosa]